MKFGHRGNFSSMQLPGKFCEDNNELRGHGTHLCNSLACCDIGSTPVMSLWFNILKSKYELYQIYMKWSSTKASNGTSVVEL